VVELLFLPCLAAFIAPPLLRTVNRNTFVLAVLALLWFADAVFLCASALGDIVLAKRAIYGGIDLVLLLITVIGGRIVPAFTANALRARGLPVAMRSWAWVEYGVIAAMAAHVFIDVLPPMRTLMPLVLISALAAIAHAIRMSGWRTRRTTGQPIVWVLHVAYAWLPLGLALKAVYLLYGFDWAARWLHALTIGAASTMIVAVITRAALGHTGRPLVVHRQVAAAYVLLFAATLVRVFAGAFLPYESSVWISGVLWLGAFSLLLVRYVPVLMTPRVDGRSG
jgi:uncharacterized protein involved in response to NO